MIGAVTTTDHPATATRIADDVRGGRTTARAVVAACLERIAAVDPGVGAFSVVLAERALAEADAVDAHPRRGDLPLAGVPVAVKDNVPVAGVPSRLANPVAPPRTPDADHAVVARLREAGAVVVGLTRTPELCVWPFTDGPLGTARNPWRTDRTPGGSSGGAAAAVAARLVPVAHGNDGMGSIRIPAAACGLVGVKPGAGVVPSDLGADSWSAMAENGPLTTTVADAALVLDVLAGRPPRTVAPAAPARVALSLCSPVPAVRVDRAWRAAAEDAADLLRRNGSAAHRAEPPAPPWLVVALLARWTAGTEADAALVGDDRRELPRRTRTHAAIGRRMSALGRVRPQDRDRMRAALDPLFARADVVLSPALAGPPPRAQGLAEAGWVRNYLAASSFAGGMQALWNLAGYPSLVVPAGVHPDGTPLAVMLSAPAGAEPTLLAAAALVERERPWARHPEAFA